MTPRGTSYLNLSKNYNHTAPSTGQAAIWSSKLACTSNCKSSWFKKVKKKTFLAQFYFPSNLIHFSPWWYVVNSQKLTWSLVVFHFKRSANNTATSISMCRIWVRGNSTVQKEMIDSGFCDNVTLTRNVKEDIPKFSAFTGDAGARWVSFGDYIKGHFWNQNFYKKLTI